MTFSPKITFSFNAWSEDIDQTCGPFDYSFILLSGGSLNSVLSFDKNTRTFSVYSEDPTKSGTY